MTTYRDGWVRPYLVHWMPGNGEFGVSAAAAYDSFHEAITVAHNLGSSPRTAVAWVEDLRLGRGATAYHYEQGIEEWHVEQPWDEPRPPEVPGDAERGRGYIRGGRQIVVYVRDVRGAS